VVLILAARERSAVPWKNGGGVTHEIAVHPPGSDLASFGWRVSMAEVACAGPFSCFDGIDRELLVIAGKLRLAIEGRTELTLSVAASPVRFAGDTPAYAEPLGAAVTDLNVMTRRGCFSSSLTRRVQSAPTALSLGAGTTLILALTALTLRTDASAAQLAPLDAARLEDVARCELTAGAGAPHERLAFCIAEIRASVPGEA
jgi:uncharacterized protein